MPIPLSLVAKLRFRQVRDERVAQRIESLSGAAGPAYPPVASVFRRIAPVDRPTIVTRSAGADICREIERAADAPRARIRPPANKNAVSTGRVRRLVS